MTDVRDGENALLVPMLILALVSVLVGYDLFIDYRSGTTWTHVVSELSALAAAGAGAVYLFRLYRQARSETRRLRSDLAQVNRDAARWRQETEKLLKGLGEAISVQFDRWNFTPAEKEIGLLLLKGLSHKEIAQLRNTSERTVRQQSLALYAKAGLSGRAELAAFFLEDLLLPVETKS